MLVRVWRHLIGVWQSRFGAVAPCDGFRRPVFIVVFDISPFVLSLSIIVIQATSHMNSVFLQLFIRKLFRLGCCTLLVRLMAGFYQNLDCHWVYVRRFLFQTTFGSGVVAGLPFMPVENLGNESLLPLPVLAIKRGRDADSIDDPGGGVLELPVGRSTAFEETPELFAFEARKVLLTDTALKVAGLLAAEPLRL